MKVRANGLSLPDLDTLAALETGRYWTPAKRPGEALYRPASNNGYWAEDIITNGLVLYVPLWLYSGAKFPSVDAYKHTCTVTGATWGIQGRTFDGATTKIAVGSIVTSGAWALFAWLKQTAVDLSGHSVFGLIGAGARHLYVNGTAGSFANHYGFYDGVIVGVANTAPAALNTWALYGWVRAGTTCSFFFNGVADGSATMAAYYPSDLYIGHRGDNAYWCEGVIGEVIGYNLAPSAADVTHLYNVTRWRYS